MKKILVITLGLLSMSTFAAIGTERFSYNVTASTEEEVLQKAEDVIPLIQRGEVKSVFQQNCWPNNSKTIKITNVSTKKNFKYVDENLVPYYSATINYLHTKCRD